MSKKTVAYTEGYKAGTQDKDVSSNPYNEEEQKDAHAEWLVGFADGVSEKDVAEEADIEEQGDDFEDEDADEDDDYE